MLFAAWVILPLWFTAMSSISVPAEMVAKPPHWIPRNPTLENYEAVFGTASKARNSSEQNARIVTSVGWSAAIGISVAVLNLVIGGLAAYGYSRFRFRGSRAGYVFLLVSRVVPAIAIITPFFVLFRVTGLINTPFALIFSYLLFTLPLSIWLLKSYFDALSPEIEEAAMVDGASRLRILWIIVAPLAAPGLIATGLLVFLESWERVLLCERAHQSADGAAPARELQQPPDVQLEYPRRRDGPVPDPAGRARGPLPALRRERPVARRPQVSDRVRVGIIGAGSWSNAVHLPALAKRDDVELGGACSPERRPGAGHPRHGSTSPTRPRTGTRCSVTTSTRSWSPARPTSTSSR